MDKILELQRALEALGIETELVLDAHWYCVDNKIHCGIELITDIETEEDCLSFNFMPNGRFITNCLEAPIKKS